jgi:hypothetical protein
MHKGRREGLHKIGGVFMDGAGCEMRDVLPSSSIDRLVLASGGVAREQSEKLQHI